MTKTYTGIIGGVEVLEVILRAPRINDTRYRVKYLGCGHIEERYHYTLRGYLRKKDQSAPAVCGACAAREVLRKQREKRQPTPPSRSKDHQWAHKLWRVSGWKV